MALLYIIQANILASEIKVTGYLYPSGIFEITSKDVRGISFYRKGKVIGANKVVVPIDSLKTGFSLRDEHLHKFLGEKKYKKIIMKNVLLEKGKAKGSGIIQINGVERKVNFNVKERKEDYLCNFKLNWKKFNLEDISFMGVYPKDEVSVEVLFLKKQIY
jgi:polyisoprenoid-binding protein YceI